jgi:hypothetical protein
MGDSGEPEQQQSRGGQFKRLAVEFGTDAVVAVSTQGAVSTFVPDGWLADALSAGAPPIVSLAVASGGLLIARLFRRADRVIEVAAEETRLTPADVVDAIRNSTEIADLFARVLEAAGPARMEDKIYALGKALALGVSEPEHLDEAHMLVEALAAIEAPHAALLGILMNKIEDDRADGYSLGDKTINPGDSSPLTMSRVAIKDAFVDYPFALQPVLARLTGAGLAYDPGGDGGGERYTLSLMGERCVELLREAANHPQSSASQDQVE